MDKLVFESWKCVRYSEQYLVGCPYRIVFFLFRKVTTLSHDLNNGDPEYAIQ